MHGVGCGQPAAEFEFALVRPVDLPQQPRACPLSQETQSEHARMKLAHGVGPCRVPIEIEARAGRLRETPGCEELGFDIHFAQGGDRFERWLALPGSRLCDSGAIAVEDTITMASRSPEGGRCGRVPAAGSGIHRRAWHAAPPIRRMPGAAILGVSFSDPGDAGRSRPAWRWRH